jgi:hypothetical protein
MLRGGSKSLRRRSRRGRRRKPARKKSEDSGANEKRNMSEFKVRSRLFRAPRGLRQDLRPRSNRFLPEGGQMEVDGSPGRNDSENREFRGPLLKKLEESKTEGEMEVSVIDGLIREAEAECLSAGPSDNYEAVCEVRAELIEDMVRAKVWSNDSGERSKTLEGHEHADFATTVFSPDCAVYSQIFLPDIRWYSYFWCWRFD